MMRCPLATDAESILLEQLTSKYSQYPEEILPFEVEYVEPTVKEKQLQDELKFFYTIDKYLFELAWVQMDKDLDKDFEEFENTKTIKVCLDTETDLLVDEFGEEYDKKKYLNYNHNWQEPNTFKLTKRKHGN